MSNRSKRRSERRAVAPLTSAVFHILLALYEKPRHGLGIADEVLRSTRGMTRLGPGTLYRSLKEMMTSGLIEETSAPPGDDDPRRKFYQLTAAGRSSARAEAERYSAVVELARRRAVLPGGQHR